MRKTHLDGVEGMTSDNGGYPGKQTRDILLVAGSLLHFPLSFSELLYFSGSIIDIHVTNHPITRFLYLKFVMFGIGSRNEPGGVCNCKQTGHRCVPRVRLRFVGQTLSKELKGNLIKNITTKIPPKCEHKPLICSHSYE